MWNFLNADPMPREENPTPDLMCQVLDETQAHYKYLVKLPSGYVYMRHKWFLCLGLGPIPKIAHRIYKNILKSKNLATLRFPNISDKVHLTWTEIHLHSTEQQTTKAAMPQSKLNLN
jgi:hypothetical protein